MGKKIEIFENLLLWNHKPYSFHIWYVASSNGPLQKLFKLWPWGQYWPRPQCQLFYKELYRKSFKRHLLPNHWTEWDQMWSECCLGEGLSKLFKSFRFIDLRGRGAQKGVKKFKSLKIFISETTSPRAFIFGIWRHLEGLYTDCSNHPARVSHDHFLGVTCFT